LTTQNTNLNLNRYFKTNTSKLLYILSFPSGTVAVCLLFGTYSHFTGKYTLQYKSTTYVLSPWNRIFPEKLTVPQPVKKFPAIL
jgi:hypothetical protein